MPLVTESQQVRQIYMEAAEAGAALPAFCTEDQRTTEAILKGVYEKSLELAKPDLPVVVAVTVNYPPRGQMNLYTTVRNTRLGIRAFFDDIDMLLSADSPYKNLRVMIHLDHAFPWLDEDALYNYTDRFATVMYDASEKPFEENIKMTSRYVNQVSGNVLVEGCVDEIAESRAGIRSGITTVEQAKRFAEETGVDLLVANLGTEHRATAAEKHYDSNRAREIAESVGRILVLHGTSCLKDDDLAKLPQDGVIKVNIYTILAVLGGQAVAEFVLQNLGNMFDAHQLEEMQKAGLIGRYFFEESYISGVCGSELKPKLDIVAETPRRDVWVSRVKEQIKYYLELLGYARF